MATTQYIFGTDPANFDLWDLHLDEMDMYSGYIAYLHHPGYTYYHTAVATNDGEMFRDLTAIEFEYSCDDFVVDNESEFFFEAEVKLSIIDTSGVAHPGVMRVIISSYGVGNTWITFIFYSELGSVSEYAGASWTFPMIAPDDHIKIKLVLTAAGFAEFYLKFAGDADYSLYHTSTGNIPVASVDWYFGYPQVVFRMAPAREYETYGYPYHTIVDPDKYCTFYCYGIGFTHDGRYSTNPELFPLALTGDIDLTSEDPFFVSGEGLVLEWENGILFSEFDPSLIKYPPPEGMYHDVNHWYLDCMDDPLRLITPVLGDVTISIRIEGPNTFGRGLQFYVNDVFIELGSLIEDGSYVKYGIRIDGVFTEGTMYGPIYKYSAVSDWQFYFNITGNTAKAGIRPHPTSYAMDWFFTDTDFLGSPAEYSTNRVSIDCYIVDSYYYLYEFFVMGAAPGYEHINGNIELTHLIQDAQCYGHLQPPTPPNPGFFLNRSELTGGGPYAVDGIDPTDIDGTGITLLPGSAVLVITDTFDISLYKLMEAETTPPAESVPDVIIPDNNPGNWYWELIDVPQFRPATQINYTDLDTTTPQTFDYTYANEKICAVHRSSVDSKVRAAKIKILASEGGVVAGDSNLPGQTSLLVLPDAFTRNQV